MSRKHSGEENLISKAMSLLASRQVAKRRKGLTKAEWAAEMGRIRREGHAAKQAREQAQQQPEASAE
jgi:hypothetical protein